MTFQTLQTLDMNFSDEFKLLCERRNTLGEIVPVSQEDAYALAEMYALLADDYAAAGYDGTNAYAIRRRAAHWQVQAQHLPTDDELAAMKSGDGNVEA